MKVIIFGATGKTGQQFVSQALAQSHQVTAYVRTPSKLTQSDANLSVVQGDVLDQDAVTAAIADHEAVICALGSSSLSDDIRSVGTGKIIAGMQANGVERLIVVSSMGVGSSKNQLTTSSKVIIKTLLRNVIADHEIQEQSVMNSGLNWTIVRPSGLTDGPRTDTYKFGNESSLKGGRISRADVADFGLKQLTDATYERQPVSVT